MQQPPKPPDRRGPRGLRVRVLAAADRGVDAGTSDLDAPAILLAGLASLPLVARRRAPLTVFVFMTCASAALYAIAAPAGPPVGPTIALYSVAAGIGESRASQRVTLAVVVVMLIVHVTAVGIQDGSFPAASLAFAIAVWAASGWRGALAHPRRAAARARGARAALRSKRPSASASSRRPRSACASRATCTTPPVTRST